MNRLGKHLPSLGLHYGNIRNVPARLEEVVRIYQDNVASKWFAVSTVGNGGIDAAFQAILRDFPPETDAFWSRAEKSLGQLDLSTLKRKAARISTPAVLEKVERTAALQDDPRVEAERVDVSAAPETANVLAKEPARMLEIPKDSRPSVPQRLHAHQAEKREAIPPAKPESPRIEIARQSAQQPSRPVQTVETRADGPPAVPPSVKIRVLETPKKRERRLPKSEPAVAAAPPKPLKVIRRRKEEAPKVFETPPKPLPEAILKGVKDGSEE